MGGIMNYKLAVIMGMVLIIGMLSGGEGLRCGDVVRSMAPCLNYLKNGGDPSPSCCDGVAKINDQAQTRDDRQQTCKCLQNASMHFSSRIDPSNAQALPSSCGLQLPYDMSLDTNCDGYIYIYPFTVSDLSKMVDFDC
ncbi:Non-specific lipid-transfer protein 12 [Euphorbia peplus]|nr:Non-specific lipid-transfer protein 12 [Euphorbia peplus]